MSQRLINNQLKPRLFTLKVSVYGQCPVWILWFIKHNEERRSAKLDRNNLHLMAIFVNYTNIFFGKFV